MGFGSPQLLGSEELANRAQSAWGVTGVAMSSPVPWAASPRPLAVLFDYGFSRPKVGVPRDEWRPTLTSPGELRFVDPYTGSLVRSEDFVGPSWTVPAEKPGSPEEQAERTKVWAALQDRLAPAFYAGEPRMPEKLLSVAEEYRVVFRRHALSMLRGYLEVAPAWCAWVGMAEAQSP
jgi:hypothetical protein